MRIRFIAPPTETARLQYLDTLHAAIVNAWSLCGIDSQVTVGRNAANWSFGAVGSLSNNGFSVKSLVIGAQGGPLESMIGRLAPEDIRKTSMNGDHVDLSSWRKSTEQLPIVRDTGFPESLPVLMLSPLAISVRGQSNQWHDNLKNTGINLEKAVNFRLSRLTGREVNLKIEPDKLYLRANPVHSIAVPIRKISNGMSVFVIGMMCPLVITGCVEDLKSAWDLGIGEKNRYGFGCIGYAGSRL